MKRRSDCGTRDGFLTWGRGWTPDRLKRPVIELGRSGDLLAGGEFRALVDPGSQSGDFRFGKLSRRPSGIFSVLVGPGNRVNQSARIRLAGDDHRAAVAALENQLPRVEPQARAMLVGPVALDAMAGEDWLDVAGVGDRFARGEPGGSSKNRVKPMCWSMIQGERRAVRPTCELRKRSRRVLARTSRRRCDARRPKELTSCRCG